MVVLSAGIILEKSYGKVYGCGRIGPLNPKVGKMVARALVL